MILEAVCGGQYLVKGCIDGCCNPMGKDTLGIGGVWNEGGGEGQCLRFSKALFRGAQ